MHLCEYAYVYVCMNLNACMCAHSWMYVSVYTYVCVCEYMCMYVYGCVYTDVYVSIYACVYVCLVPTKFRRMCQITWSGVVNAYKAPGECWQPLEVAPHDLNHWAISLSKPSPTPLKIKVYAFSLDASLLMTILVYIDWLHSERVCAYEEPTVFQGGAIYSTTSRARVPVLQLHSRPSLPRLCIEAN